MSSILTPTLIILLGSTPALVELELCQHMLSLSQEDCDHVSFVHIDTSEEPSELIAFHREHQGIFRRFGQHISVPVDIDFAPLPKEVWHTFIPSKKPQYYATGAGGIRNNGHIAAAFDWGNIDQAIEAAMQALEWPKTAYNPRTFKEIHTNIVAFLGGGTGSGILADIAILVRQKLIERQYMQRINLFCILPDWIQGSHSRDVDRRKSNATACLLELIALSLAADTQPNKIYHKYMLDEYLNVTSDSIANEVYLIGSASIGGIEGTASIVGLDLFQRITDASGVGYLEHSQWMDRITLAGRDDRHLPTMFGTSCPMEVYFPLQEVATAYAQISASYLLPHLINTSPPSTNNEMLERWKREWSDVATCNSSVQGRSLIIKPSEEFKVDDFWDASPEVLERLWTVLEYRQREIDARIESAIEQKYREEIQQIDTIPEEKPNEFTTPLAEKINHMRLLQVKYVTIRDELKRSSVRTPPGKPEWNLSWRHRIPYFGKQLRQNEAKSICTDYNNILLLRAEQTRYNFLLLTIERLLEQVREKLEGTLRKYEISRADIQQRSQQLASEGYHSPAWHGLLKRSHPHQQHIFNLRSLYGYSDEDNQLRRNLASERLYLQITFGMSEQTIDQHIMERGFVASITKERIKEFIPKYTAYLSTGRGDRFATQTTYAGLDVKHQENLVEHVITFFYEYFLEQLREKNLFELLRIGSGRGQAALVSEYLFEHLNHIKGLARSLIGFQQTLWPEGTQQLLSTVYLGLHWDDRKGELHELQEAIYRVGAINDRNQEPKIERMLDPHRLQVSYGQHGISLSTMQEFYHDTNSAMAEYIRYQRAWYGNAHPPILPNPSPNTYGSNNIPIHNCGEMERLVCDPDALGYSPKLPHTSKYGTSLIGRVIRDTARIDGISDSSVATNLKSQNET